MLRKIIKALYYFKWLLNSRVIKNTNGGIGNSNLKCTVSEELAYVTVLLSECGATNILKRKIVQNNDK